MCEIEKKDNNKIEGTICSIDEGKKENVTYILECSDHTLYTGWTNNLEKRLLDHNSGKGAKYTRARTPVSLVYCETFQTKQEAMRREYEIKQLTKANKLKLIESVKDV